MYSGTLALFSFTSSSGVANREVGLEGNYGLNEQPSGSDKDESEMTWEEKKELERKRKAAQKAIDRERKEKHRLMEEEREKVRQQLREKYNLEKPESVEEPEEDSESSSSSSEEEEEDESVDEEKVAKEEAREKVAKKIAIMMSSLVTGLFSVYLLVSFVHLKIKASVSNMRPYWDSVEL